MRLKPMLSKTGDTKILKKTGLIFEPKLDGIRALCHCDGKKCSFYGRKGQRFDFKFGFGAKKHYILDGEVVAYNEKGNPDFNLLQLGGKKTFVAFDILEKNGKDLTSLPLKKRKEILHSTIKDSKDLQTIFFTKNGKKLLEIAKQRGIEGIVAKDEDSRYYPGARTGFWQKIKLFKTVDCVILGYVSKKRKISSLKLGVYDTKGNLAYIGNVGSGFSEKMLEELSKRLENKENLVCEVRYQEFKERLRAPVFLRLREDKKPEECTIDQLE